ncbi:MAG: hypothetical protein H6R07_264 [Proteobacteria bacterium]|nr:hypothetical protein [Pseudomonadota bacterium]
MATEVIVHRTISSPAWWLFGAGLAAAAWWGLPLIESPKLENHFFGLFWYSMLALGAAFWAIPAEQRATATMIERHYGLLGLVPLWRQAYPVSQFSAVTLEQEPNIFGRDSVWVMLTGRSGNPFVFARFRATQRGVAKASQLAGALAALTGLPLDEQQK